MEEELRIKILNSIDLNKEPMSGLVKGLGFSGFNILSRNTNIEGITHDLYITFIVFLNEGISSKMCDSITNSLRESLLLNKDLISNVEQNKSLNLLNQSSASSGKFEVSFSANLKLPKKVNELDIKMIEMLKEHLNKTKAHLDINLTMTETKLVKVEINYLDIGVNDMLFYVKDTKLSILECEILKNIMLNVTALIGLYKYKLIDLDKKEDGYNCYAIVYEDSNIFDSYDITKEFITGDKHA